MSEIKLIRHKYTARSTSGGLYFGDSDERFCHTLEDTVRAKGIKVKKETALPEGVYKVSITKSRRFKREMPIIYTENNKYEVLRGGVRFVGCRFHGGNTHKHTEGCPLVAYNWVNDDTIQGTAENAVTAKIKELIEASDNDYILLKITNKPQRN